MAGGFGSVFEEIARAFEDIRHKVVEEGWFGRQVTGSDLPQSSAEELGWEMPKPSFDELWAPIERDDPPAAHAPEHEGLDMER